MMDGIPSSVPGLFDDRGEIVIDHDCKKCGYNLRGLREDGRCPECGTPIGLSTTGDLLRFADPDWVEKVARGLTIILWMILGGLIAGILAGLAGATVGQGVGTVLTFGVALISFYGVWLMTEPDPSGIGEDPNITARKVIRVTLVIGLLNSPLRFALDALDLGAVGAILVGLAMILVGLIGLIGEVAKFIYYERLARRIPDDTLAARARFLKWAFPITLGVVALGGAVVMILQAIGPAGGAGASSGPGAAAGLSILGCLMLPAGLAFIVFGVMAIFLLLRLRKRITEQAKLARASWAAALGEPR
jgi:hypothetical protein